MARRRTNASRYRIRQESLAALGIPSYDAYLASDLWQTIRGRVLARDKDCCVACGKPATAVHHATYHLSVMSGVDDEQLVSICQGCHKAIEFTWDGKKRTYTSDIHWKLSHRTGRKLGGKATKSKRLRFRPKCQCCGVRAKVLGRDDFCMACYRSGRVTRFRESQKTPSTT